MVKIAAGIVLYNPSDLERFKIAFLSVVHQFERIYIFDNSTIRVKVPVLSSKVIYLTNHKNMGISYALNKIMESADKDGYNWVVTMDQDTIVPPKMLSEYKKNISSDDIGILCPQVVDRRRIYMKPKTFPEVEYVDFCITSGSCTSVNVWRKIGKFDENLFIDLVDNDFCKRVILSKYKILRLNNIILDQEFGDISPRSLKSQKFWLKISSILHNVNFAKLGYRKKVNPMRIYYTNRNIIYVNKKLANYNVTIYEENYNVRSYIGFWICFNLPSIIRAKNKLKVVGAIRKGISDGLKMKVSKWVR